jgi:hypothetical protein
MLGEIGVDVSVNSTKEKLASIALAQCRDAICEKARGTILAKVNYEQDSSAREVSEFIEKLIPLFQVWLGFGVLPAHQARTE